MADPPTDTDIRKQNQGFKILVADLRERIAKQRQEIETLQRKQREWIEDQGNLQGIIRRLKERLAASPE